MATNYPGSLDDFATTSPAKLSDDDSTGRTHAERHNDVESAVEAIQGELGTDPAGAQATVKARLEAAELGAFGNAYWPSGGYVHNSVTAGSTTNTGSLSADVIYYSPIWVPTSATVNAMVVSVVTGQTSANAKVGLYTSTAAGLPSTRVLDAGSVAVATATDKLITSLSCSVVPGLYYSAIVFDTANVSMKCPAVGSQRVLGSDSAMAHAIRGFYESGTYSTGLPATASISGNLNTCIMMGLGRS